MATNEDGIELVECPHCGKLVEPDQLVDWMVSRQTHWEPAEYEDGCTLCAPQEDHGPRHDTLEEHRGER